MELKRISKGEMPPEDKYVLIYCEREPWIDNDDPSNVYWKVAKCIYGISKEQRKKLSESNRIEDRRRAYCVYAEDEFFNNKKPYCFKEFGPGSIFGQNVDIWCELPNVSEVGV